MTIEELRARQTEIKARLDEMNKEFAGRAYPDDIKTEWNTLNEERDENETTIGELEARASRLAELEGVEPSREDGAAFHTPRSGVPKGADIFDLSTVRSSVSSPEQAAVEMRDRAKRMLEDAQFPHPDAEQARTKAHVERLLQVAENEKGELARHLLQTGSPIYNRAFGKALRGQPLTSEESRALSVGTDNKGGFAVPFQLDPTVIPTSNGTVNPYRAIARVESIVGTDEWKGVSSDGVTVSRAAESAEAADNSPTLAQPSVKATRVHAFVPFSIEVGQDWGGMQAEVARMLQDAKDDEEAAAFTVGDGVDPNPEGVITGATETVDTAAASTFAAADIYTVEEALGPRFRPRAQWVAARGTYNKVRQFDVEGGSKLWLRLPQGLQNAPQGNTGAELLGYPANEASAMATGLADNAKILTLGDFRYFLIVDRIGMSIELIPHLFGANRRPTGQRGIYAIWRNGSKVLSPKAFKTLKVKAA
jgi:HK97 family phage major capsid protein